MATVRTKRANFRRDQLVVKSNDLVQKARYNLSLEEQRIIAYLISHIRPDDNFLHEINFSIQSYCDACGILWDGGKTYSYIQASLKSLRDKSFWVPIEKYGEVGERTVSWFSYIESYPNSGNVKIKFDEMMIPYLLQLRERFTTYQLRNVLAMRSKYSVRLYELLKSYINLHEPVEFELERLKELLDAQTYLRFPDFKRKVLDISIREIMDFSDIHVTYHTEKYGRAVGKVIFLIRPKNQNESINVWAHQDDRLNPEQLRIDNF